MADRALAAAQAEFSALRAEILIRLQAQSAAVAAALAISGAIGAVAFGGEHDRLEILLVLPFVLGGLGFLHLEHSHRTAVLGTYIREKLWKEIAAPVGQLSWETYLSDYRAQPGRRLIWQGIGGAPYALIYFTPAAAALVLTALAENIDREGWFWWVWAGGAVVLVAVVLLTLFAELEARNATAGELPSGRLN